MEAVEQTTIQWTPYLACAYIEGFNEGENATHTEQLQAWAYVARTGLWRSLQGFYGRSLRTLIENGYLTEDGTILVDLSTFDTI